MAMYKIGHRLTVTEFQRLGHEGAFPADARLELVDGEVREMSPIGVSHAWIVDQLSHALITQLPDYYVRTQNPIDLDKYNEPQPDLVVARRTPAFKLRHPLPPDILLVIEVSDSTLRQDRRQKIPPLRPLRHPRSLDHRRGPRTHPRLQRTGRSHLPARDNLQPRRDHPLRRNPFLRLPVETAFD